MIKKSKRRVRYKGTHPRKFSEKYKELNPEQYKEDIEKIKKRGVTPVGTHRPICVDEIIKVLNPKPGDSVLDATLGYGGHALEILKRIIPGGRLLGIDQDSVEIIKTENRFRDLGFDKTVFQTAHINFKDIKTLILKKNLNPFDFIIADLGISSMQLDDPHRGFSYKINAPLDWRMNQNVGESAHQLIERLNAIEISDLLKNNSDEIRSHVIGKAIAHAKPKTTHELANAIKTAISGFSKPIQKKEGDAPIRRAFQAFRIEVNQELKSLEQFLLDLPDLLKPNGRVSILSFHSGEDRRVKKSFQNYYRSNVYKNISDGFMRPSIEEQIANPRSKSAKLRWAIKT